MRKSFIYENADTYGFKRAFKIWMYGYRVISLSITVIDSFILACQCIFLRVLVSMHPRKMNLLGLKRS